MGAQSVIADKLQITLAMVKPHILKYPYAAAQIRKIILEENFKIVKTKRLHIPLEVAGNLYEEHVDKFFYNRLMTFITSGPSDLHIMARHNAISHWRQVMGPTKVYKTQYSHPESIRGRFGLSDTRNAVHGSDSDESARREIHILFPDFSIDNWYNNEEKYFRNDQITFDHNIFEHSVVR